MNRLHSIYTQSALPTNGNKQEYLAFYFIYSFLFIRCACVCIPIFLLHSCMRGDFWYRCLSGVSLSIVAFMHSKWTHSHTISECVCMSRLGWGKRWMWKKGHTIEQKIHKLMTNICIPTDQLSHMLTFGPSFLSAFLFCCDFRSNFASHWIRACVIVGWPKHRLTFPLSLTVFLLLLLLFSSWIFFRCCHLYAHFWKIIIPFSVKSNFKWCMKVIFIHRHIDYTIQRVRIYISIQ